MTAAKTTFQTGLRFAGGNAKPSYNAYRVPLYVVDNGRSLTIWGGSPLSLAGERGRGIEVIDANSTTRELPFPFGWKEEKGLGELLGTVLACNGRGIFVV